MFTEQLYHEMSLNWDITNTFSTLFGLRMLEDNSLQLLDGTILDTIPELGLAPTGVKCVPFCNIVCRFRPQSNAIQLEKRESFKDYFLSYICEKPGIKLKKNNSSNGTKSEKSKKYSETISNQSQRITFPNIIVLSIVLCIFVYMLR